MNTRREFISLLGGAAAALPLAARQQPERLRRIGVLPAQAATDSVSQARNAAFLQGLQELGWMIGRNVEIEYRWAPGDVDNSRRNAEDLVALAPDVILATGGVNMGPLLQVTRTVPIVFVQVTDPVGAGYVQSLARPGGNATGFIPFEFGTSGKWLELLKEIAPGIRRVAVLRDAALAMGMGQLGAIQSVSPSFGVELRPVGVADANEIERGITAFARDPHGALILTVSPAALRHREMIIGLAARHKLPAVYPYRFFATEGGLVSYGPDTIEPYRRAAGYVDRILKGEKPADLPVQEALLAHLKAKQAGAVRGSLARCGAFGVDCFVCTGRTVSRRPPTMASRATCSSYRVGRSAIISFSRMVAAIDIQEALRSTLSRSRRDGHDIDGFVAHRGTFHYEEKYITFRLTAHGLCS